MTTAPAAPKALTGQKSATDTKVATIRDLLQRSQSQIALALPKYMSADRMTRLAMTSILRNPKLLECDPLTLVGAVIQCAQLGLEPGSNFGAHLVPFWNTKAGKRDVQVIPDYRGLMGLARNSEQISTIDAHAVYEQDHFEFAYGKDPDLVHVPRLSKDRGEIKYFYAVARLKDGGVQFVVLGKWEVDEIRDRYSRAAGDGPWVTNYEEMGKKSCIRRLVDYLPARIELLTAAGLEAKAEQGIPQDLGALLDTQEEKVEKALESAKPMGAVAGLVQELKEKQNGGTAAPPPSVDANAPPAPAQPAEQGNPSPPADDQVVLEQEARAREQAEAAADAAPPKKSRQALLHEITELENARRMGAQSRAALHKAQCGNEPLSTAPMEKLGRLLDHLKQVGASLV